MFSLHNFVSYLRQIFSFKSRNNNRYLRVLKRLEELSKIDLIEGQTFLLTPPSSRQTCLKLSVLEGTARISGSFGADSPDVTLAFCAARDSDWHIFPKDMHLLLEALSNITINIGYFDRCPVYKDLLSQWIFDLHLVNHQLGSDSRLLSLFQLLINRYGIRVKDGLCIPFFLGHSRIAEIIRTTRSTVTRQISLLRKESSLQISHPERFFLFDNQFICNNDIFK